MSMSRQATLSSDGKNRYTLIRTWDETKPPLLFIMLNPSTADATTDDATVRKCIGFGQRLGFGSIRIANLFTIRARDPSELKKTGYPYTPGDDLVMKEALFDTMERAGIVCCAWGTNARKTEVDRRARAVKEMIMSMNIPAYSLRILKDGIPSHPLMLSYECKLQRYL